MSGTLISRAAVQRSSLLAGLLAIVVATMILPTGRPADHQDGDRVKTDGRVDITDVYVFQSPVDPNNTVLVMDVNPFAGIMSPVTFRPDAAYEFMIHDPDNNVARLSLRVHFSVPNDQGAQAVTLIAIDEENVHVLAKGLTSQNIPVKGGGTLRCDIFSDPFFFDLDAFHRFQDRLAMGDTVEEAGQEFCIDGETIDFFAGANVTSIVLEIPSAKLLTGDGQTVFRLWARTVVADQQFDRMGLPTVNTVFMPPERKDEFNSGQPDTDRAQFGDQVKAVLILLGNDDQTADQLTQVILPDLLTFDTARADGFPNGRRLADDVIDILLDIITAGVVTTDCVGPHSDYRDTFPYLGPPNQARAR
jgi:hypothetical protein